MFGVEVEPDRKQTEKQRRDREANNQHKFDDFWQQLNRAATATHDPRLTTLLAFQEQVGQSPPFLRWGVSSGAGSGEKPRWWIRTASGTETRLGPDNFTFQAAETGLCLVTGEIGVTIAPTHSPKIKGVPNTQSFGAAIVSFDKDAFTSYGFDQSYNAPVSTTAVAAYCNALNWLLSRNDHSIRLGGTKLCFWARQSETSFFAQMLEQPDPQTVAEFVKSPWTGIDRHLARQDRFYSVTLAGNAGRVVIRHWMQTSLETACENLRNWFLDLDMVALSQPRTEHSRRKKTEDATTEPTTDKAGTAPLALFRLACSTVREAKELQTEVLSQLYSAPNSAFGILWRLHQHHLKKISRQGEKGKAKAEAIKRRIAEIAALFRPLQPGLPVVF